jgi:hypothetical protein
MADRDIELVLVTGAGASRAFGFQRPFPLMGEWSKYLIKKIADAPSVATSAMAAMNYDTVGEAAIKGLGLRPDWGRPPQLDNPSSDEDLQVEGLIGAMPRYVPVLHLHGRVGWYLRPGRNDGRVTDMIVQNYNKDWGTPIVMWPDDRKDTSSYQATQVINDLWQQLSQALSRAKRVVVLGHSLHDSVLVQNLKELVEPTRVAVTFHPDAPPHEVEHLRSSLPQANFLPVNFGAEPSNVAKIQAWSASIRQ